MATAILIDSAKREVREVTIGDGDPSLGDIQRLIGGDLEAAFIWSTDEALFVDENGLLNDPQSGFVITVRTDQALAGNGVIVGRERTDRHGRLIGHDAPSFSIDDIRAIVRFVP